MYGSFALPSRGAAHDEFRDSFWEGRTASKELYTRHTMNRMVDNFIKLNYLDEIRTDISDCT